MGPLDIAKALDAPGHKLAQWALAGIEGGPSADVAWMGVIAGTPPFA